MVEIFKTVNGEVLERFIADLNGVQSQVDAQTLRIGGKAEANLAAHRSSGDSFIEVERSDLDGYVVLNDTRGQLAAMSIEFGRGPGDSPGDPFPNGTTPTHVLHDAAGLPFKAVRPNSRRRKSLRKRFGG